MSELEFRIENCTFGDPIGNMIDKIRALTEEEIKRQTEILITKGRKQELLIEAYEEACSDDINERVKECVEKYFDGHSQ